MAKSHRKKAGKGVSGARLVYNNYKAKAANRGHSFNLNFMEFCEITSRRCFYCGLRPKQVREHLGHKSAEGRAHTRYFYNGVDRINNAKGYETENVVPCCKQCNAAKSNLQLRDFRLWLERLVRHGAAKKVRKLE